MPGGRRIARGSLGILLVLSALLGAAGSLSHDGLAGPPGEVTDGTLPQGSAGEWKRHKPEFLKIAEKLYGGSSPYLGRAPLERLRAALKNPDLGGPERLGIQGRLAGELLQAGGGEAEAVALLESVRGQVELLMEGPKNAATLYSHLGLAYLRLAEVQNCIRHHNPESCLFPLKGGGIHRQRDAAVKARAYFERALEFDTSDLAIRWLLNIAAMAIGEYPDKVSPRYLLPPEAFESDYDIGRFRDIAPDLGVDTFNLAGGVIVEDMDGDGLLDIVTSTNDPKGPLTYSRNLGNGRFEDLSEASRLSDQLGGLNMVGADYDGDGDTDILILRGAWLFDDGQIRNSLLRNNGDGTFTDVTAEAGLAYPARPTQAVTWGDFDGDGHLDLFIANESRVSHDPNGNYPSQLFHNNTNGTFSDVAKEAGVTNDRYGKGVTAGDFDNDGDLDIYVSNVGVNRLYRNDGKGRFTDVAEKAGVTGPEVSFVPWFFDYDNDGHLDLFVGAFKARIDDLAAEALGLPHKAELPRLYRNRGDGTFEDVTRRANLDHVYLPMGANFGDLDHDGWLDMYLTTGNPGFETLMPNVMLRNDRGVRFQDVTQSGGFGHLQKGHGVGFADLDHDGDQDVYHQLGGFFPADKFSNSLFLNPGHKSHYLYVKLVGTRSNRGGVGARIRLLLRTPAGKREIHRAAGAVSSFGGSPSRQEIGLGDATGIERLDITWPTSGTRQSFSDVPLDTMIRVTEGEERYDHVELKRFKF
jgi:hypothetical protein